LISTKNRSPFNLLQEIYFPDEWKILTCCILLNQTTRKQVDNVRDEFFKKFPTPQKLVQADSNEIIEVIQSLGFKNRRVINLQKMSEQYIGGNWNEASDLFGIGKYGNDSYQMFIKNNSNIKPTDHALTKYMNWWLNSN
jgi:methyl-CpG-binding domain protein 4